MANRADKSNKSNRNPITPISLIKSLRSLGRAVPNSFQLSTFNSPQHQEGGVNQITPPSWCSVCGVCVFLVVGALETLQGVVGSIHLTRGFAEFAEADVGRDVYRATEHLVGAVANKGTRTNGALHKFVAVQNVAHIYRKSRLNLGNLGAER